MVLIQKEKLEELYNLYTIKAIGEILKTSPSNVRRYVKIYNLKKPLRDKNKKAINIDLITSLYEQGKSILEIAKELNASYDCISSVINTTKDSKYPKFKSLYTTQKKSIPEIAEILNISPATIWRWSKKLNLQRHKPITKTTLTELYLKQNLSIPQVAKKLNVPKEDVIVAINIHKTHKRRLYVPSISKEQILSVYPSLSLKEASDKLNIPPSRLLKILHTYNIAIRKRGRSTTTLDKEILQDLYINQNISMKRISKILNVCVKVIQKQVKLYNLIKPRIPVIPKPPKIRIPKPPKPIISKAKVDTPLPKEKIIDLYVNTYSMYKAYVAVSEIAKELNTSKTRIIKFIRQNKIKR